MNILYFYPENPLCSTQGNNARALSLLNYFKSRNINVDFVGIESDIFCSENIKELEAKNLIYKGYLLKEFKRKNNQIKYLLNYSLPNIFFGRIKYFNRLRFSNKSHFNKILKSNEYDYIIVSYVYWAGLVIGNSNTKNSKLCIDTHDFLTAQFQNSKGFHLGNYFKKEIEILSNFDKIFVVSLEENYLFSQFIKKEVITLSHIIENNFSLRAIEKEFDLIYVASNNEHNVAASNWFFKEVYPLLDNKIQILVIGKISNYIKIFNNVTKLNFVENLNDYYLKSKVAICPMFTGTGLKIKVIEALSYGLPIVCNLRGVDGMNSKINNGCLVTNNPKEFAANIESLLNNNNYYFKIANFGKEYFINNNDLKTCYKKIDDIFE